MVLATSAPVNDEKVSQSYCEKLASKVSSLGELPVQCREYKSVVQKLESRETKNAFAGMSPGEAARARAARAHGLESHAQIQRRLTRGSRTFSKN